MGQRAVKAFLSVPMVSGASKLGTRRMPQLGNSLLPNCRVVAGGSRPTKNVAFLGSLFSGLRRLVGNSLNWRQVAGTYLGSEPTIGGSTGNKHGATCLAVLRSRGNL